MGTDDTVGGLMFFTLIAVALVAVVLLLAFLRRRSNRHPMEHQRERNIAEIKEGVPPQHDRG